MNESKGSETLDLKPTTNFEDDNLNSGNDETENTTIQKDPNFKASTSTMNSSLESEKKDDEEFDEEFSAQRILVEEEGALTSIRNKVSGRVKYSCLDASGEYLVFGANTGSIYFFERKT